MSRSIPRGARTEYNTPGGPDLRKVPALRDALNVAGLAKVARAVGCKAEDLKPFANGTKPQLGGGLRSRVIQALTPEVR